MSDLLLRRRLMIGSPLSYIETDGLAYIDSGVVLSGPNASFRGKVLLKPNTQSETVVGQGDIDGSYDTLQGLYHSATGPENCGFAFYYLYASVVSISDSILNVTPFEFETSLKQYEQKLGVKQLGESVFTYSGKNVSAVPSLFSNLFIFASNNNGNPVKKLKEGSRIYSIKIYSDATFTNLVFDGKPWRMGGNVGLLDLVSNKFFGNANNTGNFIGG